jgi:hypothetical protein
MKSAGRSKGEGKKDAKMTKDARKRDAKQKDATTKNKKDPIKT